MAGDPVVLIDNVKRPVEGDWLCSMITSEEYQARMLGRNAMVRVPTRVLFLVTGNNLIIQGDMTTRSLLCRIDPKVEKPGERVFKEDLKDIFMRQRPELVVACLTVIRAYLLAGEKSSVFRPWGRFEQWSRFCREPLMWLGLTDPCDSYAKLTADDPERQEHIRIMEAWLSAIGVETEGKSKAVTAREAIEQAAFETNKELRQELGEVARGRDGMLSAKRLGKWLHAHDNKVVAGKKIERHGESKGSALWRVVNAA
jgi:hypothetical protein